jgi:hypothetical protein
MRLFEIAAVITQVDLGERFINLEMAQERFCLDV